jgi:hypothetical protein
MNKRIDWPNLSFGLFLLALAATVLWTTAPLRVGTIDEMGPGFAPRALALAILGFAAAFIAIGVFSPRQPFPAFAWRPLIAITGAIAAFALITAKLGLIAAVAASVLIAGAAQSEIRWEQQAIFGVIVAAFSALLFVKFIGIPLPLWWF